MKIRNILKVMTILGLCVSLSSCEPPQVYGSVGYSNFSGGYGYGGGMGTSVSIGGRIL